MAQLKTLAQIAQIHNKERKHNVDRKEQIHIWLKDKVFPRNDRNGLWLRCHEILRLSNFGEFDQREERMVAEWLHDRNYRYRKFNKRFFVRINYTQCSLNAPDRTINGPSK